MLFDETTSAGWTETKKKRKDSAAAGPDVCIEKLIKALQDTVKAVQRKCVRDAAPGAESDERELFADLRTGLLIGDNDTVIRCHAETLPAKSSLCRKNLDNPPAV